MSSAIVQEIILAILMVIAFIPAICVHEWAHGFAAYKLGDPTAKRAGRLTLNPIKHIDPLGSVVLPGILILLSAFSGGSGIIFGYAKPVPYNPRYFKNIKKGEVIVGFAGPVSNILMALIGAAIAWAANFLMPLSVTLAVYIWYFGQYFCTINLCLAFFNLIPLPPLDGSSILALFLPRSALPTFYNIQRYSFWIFFIVVILLPQFIGIDIVGWYLNLTAGNIANLLLG